MRLVRYLLMCLLVISGNSVAEINSVEQAINTTSHQGMLTQQMLKNYILMGMSVRARKAEQELNKAIVEYEFAHTTLETYAKTDSFRNALTAAEAQWQKVKPLYLKGVSKDQVEEVRRETEALLQHWNSATREIVESEETKFGRLISTAGFVRMLSQRVNSHYALRAWGFPDKYEEAFESSLDQFEANREALESSELNNKQIKTELSKIQRDFERFKGLHESEANRGLLALVSRSSEKITKSMDKLTAMYMYQGLSF